MMSFSRINRSALSELIVHKKSHIISRILLGIAGVMYADTTMKKDADIDVSWYSVFFFVTALFPLFFACVNIFRDMHDVPSADVQMAMPLSAKERFFSKMMTLCYIWFFPYVFFAGTGNILSCMINSIDVCDAYGKITEHASFPEMFAMNIKVFVMGLSAALFITGVTVLCACCIGSKAESIYLPAILMLVVSVFPAETAAFINDKFYDISALGEYDRSLWQIFGFGALTYDISEPYTVILVLVNCLMSLGLIAAAMFAYGKRDATTVGYPVVYRGFFEMIMLISLMSLFQLAHGSYTPEYFVLGIFLIGSVILRIIVSRKDITPLKFVKWTGIFAGYYAAFILLSYIVCVTSAFGGNEKKPDMSEVIQYKPITVSVSYSGPGYSTLRKTFVSPYTGEDLLDRTISPETALSVMDLTADYISIQNRNPGYFTDTMFRGIDYYHEGDSESDAPESRTYHRIDLHIDAYTDSYTRSIYRASLSLDKDNAEKYCDALTKLVYR